MADEIHHGSEFYQKDRKFKDLGDGSFAEVVALEPGSIGGSSPTADVKIVDATTPTQKAAVSAAGRLAVELPAGGGGLTDTELRASPVPVSQVGTVTTDPSDRVGRLLGHVTVDNASIPVTGTFWQATQPVSIAGTVTTDPSDRVGRLLGHVTVDNASLAVTGTFWQGTQPISAVSLPLPAGAATDANQTLIFGGPNTIPGAYTVLDYLMKANNLSRDQNVILQKLLDQGKPKILPKSQPTLLHRY